MSVIKPNAIEVRVFLYHNGERNVVVSCPNRSLIHPLANMIVEHGLDTFSQQSRRFVVWCISTIEHGVCDYEANVDAMQHISIDDMRAILEYSNEQLGCTHPSGSVEVDDSDCQLSNDRHLLEKMRKACNSVQMDYTAEANDYAGITKLTVENLLLVAETAMDLKRLAEATVANRENGNLIDLEG